MDAAPVVAGLIEEGEQKAEIQRKQWEEERREYERTQAEERAAKAQKDSRDELVQIVKTWVDAKRLEEFFTDAEARIEGLEPDLQRNMRDRLARARKLIGGVDALEKIRRWRAPSERLAVNAFDDSDDEDC
jgi:GTP1/Obg family GTP-binding protein